MGKNIGWYHRSLHTWGLSSKIVRIDSIFKGGAYWIKHQPETHISIFKTRFNVQNNVIPPKAPRIINTQEIAKYTVYLHLVDAYGKCCLVLTHNHRINVFKPASSKWPGLITQMEVTFQPWKSHSEPPKKSLGRSWNLCFFLLNLHNHKCRSHLACFWLSIGWFFDHH